MFGTIDKNDMRTVTKTELNFILDPQDDVLSDELMNALNDISDDEPLFKAVA